MPDTWIAYDKDRNEYVRMEFDRALSNEEINLLVADPFVIFRKSTPKFIKKSLAQRWFGWLTNEDE